MLEIKDNFQQIPTENKSRTKCGNLIVLARQPKSKCAVLGVLESMRSEAKTHQTARFLV